MDAITLLVIVVFILSMLASGIEYARSRAIGWIGVLLLALGLLIEAWPK